MSSDDPVAAMLGKMVETGRLAGAATLVWRADRGAQVTTVGWRDREARLPMQRDTIFRIASMTKPITSTAALRLYEAGRFALDDPITRWAPEFAQMRVLHSPTAALDQTDPAERPITFRDLLTHRAGLTYGSFHDSPLAEAYDEVLGSDIDSELAPDEWLARLATLPLLDQPGASFHYSNATDLLGLLIARMEDAPLGEVLQRRIFGPLGMVDTGFTVPVEKRGRRAKLYGFDKAGHMEERPRGSLRTGRAGALLAERPADMAFASGGAGLWSTLDDYLAFARMFVEAGAVDGVRLLRPETLTQMTANQLTDRQRAQARLLGQPTFAAHGFGMGVAVVLNPARAAAMICQGGVGTVGWPGAYGGWWQADPTDGTVLIFLAHNVLELDQFAQGIGLDVYSAIMQFHALATAAERSSAQG